jgi:hypothetical protein
MSGSTTALFLEAKKRALVGRATRLARLTPRRVGLRPQDMPYAPTSAHFAAANRRLAEINASIATRFARLSDSWRHLDPPQRLTGMAMLERDLDRARRTFGMFFELFSQRGSSFAPALAAHDVIALDCYQAIRRAAPDILSRPLLKPVTYMEHGYSPATMRRGVQLARLLGDSNPFPVIRIPWDRDNPWQAVFLHEVSHNLQADLGLWQENETALRERMRQFAPDPQIVSAYRRWHKEIFADLAAMLLGGPAAAAGMMAFLAHPSPRVMTYRPGGAHPTGYLRGFILAEMLDRMGFGEDAGAARSVWRTLYDRRRGHRIPPALLSGAQRTIASVVDEIAYQPRRALGQRALADIIPFRKEDQAEIRRATLRLSAGQVPTDVPPRFLSSASSLAVAGGADATTVSRNVIQHLARRAAASGDEPLLQQAAA